MGNLAKGASSLVGSPALVAAMLSFTIAQICKVFTHYHTHGKVDWGRLVGSGGMPSSHTALVVGLTTAIGLKDALDSSIFALCLVFSLVVSVSLRFCGLRARLYIVGKRSLCLGRCRISTFGSLSRETERWMMISLSSLWFSFVSRD